MCNSVHIVWTRYCISFSELKSHTGLFSSLSADLCIKIRDEKTIHSSRQGWSYISNSKHTTLTINRRPKNNTLCTVNHILTMLGLCLTIFIAPSDARSTSNNDSWWNASNFNLTLSGFSAFAVLTYSASSGDTRDVVGLRKQSLENQLLNWDDSWRISSNNKNTKGGLHGGTKNFWTFEQ